MNDVRFWQSIVTFDNNHKVVRRFRADEIVCGSHPRAQLHVSHPAPSVLFTVERIVENGKEMLRFETDCSDVQIEVLGTYQHLTEFQAEKLPAILYKDQKIHLSEISNERTQLRFQPEKWAAEATHYEPDYFALWHIADGVLAEAVLMEKNKPSALLKNGYRILWNEKNPMELQLIEFDGIAQKIEMKPGRLGAPRAQVGTNVFVVTRVPDKHKLLEIPSAQMPANESRLNRYLLAGAATWMLLISLLQFVPITPKEETLEDMPAGIAKIILEAPKAVDGGDRFRGGGGQETVARNDRRGGSGLEAQKMNENSGEEVVVRDKGALAALSKAEKVVGAGVMKALEVTGKLASALSALDEGMKSGKIKTAGIGSFGTRPGGGSANGVLGALGKIGSGGAGGQGVGMGGVGTKGFGGGGGGGQGNGFGTGVGSGLGKGEGARTVAFDSDNVAVRGGLERSEVDAVIQENLSQIRFCYNRGLRGNPSLNGKVTSAFTIGGDGVVKVSRISTSTLAASEVENCIMSKVASWKFPEPRGGGEVIVNYPFLFKSN